MSAQRADGTGEARFWAGAEHAKWFFLGQGDVHHAMAKLARTLDEAGIPYAVAGVMALNEHGYRRVTVGVDVLLTREGLDALKQLVLRRGYVENGVAIDILIAGEYPGDSKPKPIAFPDPAQARSAASPPPSCRC